MKPSATEPSNTSPVDEDIAEQARPGHGIPSQDPDPAAQFSQAPADSVRLHIDDSGGSGRPVVLIHGWPLSAQAWEPQVSVLRAAGYRVVAYDRRGFGRSDKPESGYSYDTLADDLQRVMDQCGLQDVTLVGFSMGGGEVARYIGRFGESRLHSVVFAAAVPPYLMKTADNPDGPLTAREGTTEEDGARAGPQCLLRPASPGTSSRPTGRCRSPSRSASEAIALCHQSAQHAALACMDSFGTTDFRDDLKKVDGAHAGDPRRRGCDRADRRLGPAHPPRRAAQQVGDGERRAARTERVPCAGVQRRAVVVPAGMSSLAWNGHLSTLANLRGQS